MKVIFLLFLFFSFTAAGTHSAWSDFFTLEGGISVEKGSQKKAPAVLHFTTIPLANSIAISTAAAGGILKIYDLSGKLVRTLHLDLKYGIWDLCDGRGRPVTSGTYLGRLTSGKATFSKTITVVH